jgi:hypothetical protein
LTNEPYDQSITSEFGMVVKFGPEYNDDNEAILIIPHGAYEIAGQGIASTDSFKEAILSAVEIYKQRMLNQSF